MSAVAMRQQARYDSLISGPLFGFGVDHLKKISCLSVKSTRSLKHPRWFKVRLLFFQNDTLERLLSTMRHLRESIRIHNGNPDLLLSKDVGTLLHSRKQHIINNADEEVCILKRKVSTVSGTYLNHVRKDNSQTLRNIQSFGANKTCT